MIAQEWEKIKAPKHLFLLSTIPSRNLLPNYLKFAGFLRLHKLLPIGILSRPNPINYYFFGVPNNTNRAVFKSILEDTDEAHLKWAINAILNWENTQKSRGIWIHGTKDRILPIKQNVHVRIPDAGHMAVMNNADFISEILQNTFRE